MNYRLKKRTIAALSKAIYLQSSYYDTLSIERQITTANAVAKRLSPDMVVSQSGPIVVTEVGFVTMALLLGHAVYRKDLLLIPGIDELKQFGFLVLREGFVPYHSQAQNIDDAASDTYKAHSTAEELVAYFGDKASLKKAAKEAPWHMWSTLEDARAAGLCQWGAINFLRRLGLTYIGRNYGVPRVLLRLAGAYGDRVSAATLRRLEQDSKTGVSVL